MWNVAALAEAAGMPAPVILAYRDPWEAAFTSLVDVLRIPPAHAARVQYVDTTAEALKVITTAYGAAAAAAEAAVER